ncbi:hypothetical protein BJD99_14625 [Rhodococcus sp. 1163]|nr:hypothetical protein BJD99_14625 [Rhodococcus sp. 1163]
MARNVDLRIERDQMIEGIHPIREWAVPKYRGRSDEQHIACEHHACVRYVGDQVSRGVCRAEISQLDLTCPYVDPLGHFERLIWQSRQLAWEPCSSTNCVHVGSDVADATRFAHRVSHTVSITIDAAPGSTISPVFV